MPPAPRNTAFLRPFVCALATALLTACGGDAPETNDAPPPIETDASATPTSKAPLTTESNDARLTPRDESARIETAVKQAQAQAAEAMRKAEAAKADRRPEETAEQSLLAAERAQQRAKALEDAALIEAQRRKTAAAAQPPPLPSGTMTALPPQMQEPVKKAQALTAELHRAKARLKDLHQQALQTPVVLASQDKLEAAALREIEKTAPGIKPEWHRLKALANEMEELRKTARSGQLPQGIQGKMMEMEKLSAKIRPLQMQVAELPEIQKLKAEFAATVDAELLKLDPDAANLKARHEAILEELEGLREQLSKLQGRVARPAPSVTRQPNAAAPGN